jgi:hypothetical protein
MAVLLPRDVLLLQLAQLDQGTAVTAVYTDLHSMCSLGSVCCNELAWPWLYYLMVE